MAWHLFRSQPNSSGNSVNRDKFSTDFIDSSHRNTLGIVELRGEKFITLSGLILKI
jgi:hypothetical protein